MSTARRRATYEDLCAVPEYRIAEIVDGELIVSPRPAPRHAVAHSAILAQVHGAFGGPTGESGPAGWWIPFELAPDWVCEVGSPSSGRLDRVRKRPVYARAGSAPFAAVAVDPRRWWADA